MWLDPRRWPCFVDGFGQLVHMDERWPAPGSTLVWNSPPRGRGRVLETVVTHTPGALHAVDIEDERLDARQEIQFEPIDGGVGVMLSLHYSLKGAGAWRALLDRFFVRRALTDALARTLARFGTELEAEERDLR